MPNEKQQSFERKKKQYKTVYKKEVPYRKLPHKKKKESGKK